MTGRVLVVSATHEEARYVPAELPQLVTGIGKVAAASAVAAALAVRDRASDLLVLNIGSAGALREGINGLWLPSTVINHDISAGLLAQIGRSVQTSLDIPGGDGSVLATGDTFVSDVGLRDQLAQRASLVDMEGFAVAWACAQEGVACRLVKHVSDPADESALDWALLVEASARALGTWLRETVLAG
jgi:nucleoside phosphorylase